MRQKFNIITLGVENLERSLEFYEKGLGWKKSSASQGDIAFFSLGGMVLALYPRHLLAEDATVSDQPTGFSGITIAHNTSSEKEVDDVMQLVSSIGGTIIKPAQKVFWGGYSGYFKDPDGHLFEVAFNPYSELDSAGNLQI
jgi:catechol 2,3-dioxygenase-like lactoylglutathione lyase family enzyme